MLVLQATCLIGMVLQLHVTHRTTTREPIHPAKHLGQEVPLVWCYLSSAVLGVRPSQEITTTNQKKTWNWSDVTLDQWIDLLHRYSYLDNVIQVHLYAISCNIMQPYPDIVGVVVESRRQRMDRALFMPFPHQSSRSIEFPRPKKFQLPTRLKKKNCRYSNWNGPPRP